MITTTYVFDEVVTFFNSRGLHQKAVEIGNRLRRSPRLELVPVTEELFNAGWERFQERSDKRYSLTDCISFVAVERRDLSATLAFDPHFEQGRFTTFP